MAGKEGFINRGLDTWQEINKITLVGALGFAAVAAVVAPPLVTPALTIAVIDGGQMLAINHLRNNRK